MKNANRSRGFTLIELLIVVAIIAILAAIAVPNFLEAQTRAKVSRAKSDMRTISTALESYKIDTNKYPEQGVPNGSGVFPYSSDTTKVYGGDSPLHASNNPAIAYHLSTPVSYLASTTAVFRDPFFTEFGRNSTSLVNDTRYYNYSGDYYYGRIYDASQDGGIDAYQQRVIRLNMLNHWHLRARGPDGDYERRSQGWEEYLEFHGARGAGPSGTGGIDILYDPTNGTASNGDLVRFGSDGVKN
ncbi:MAG: prepilin-type N-terminal cleavage/methylation domain-containing protein [bacterium]|nr:prepilin-type N-terminal cleavage/methylation domain-containing protein [Candidatus Sumerlaeota bacterium]